MTTPLRGARDRTEYSQADIAKALSIDQGHYSRIESGKVRPAPDLARRISSFLGGAVTPLEILDPQHYMEQEPEHA